MSEGTMYDLRLKRWSRLSFKDPAKVLIRLRPLQEQIAQSSLPDKLKALRTNTQKGNRQAWHAAIFAYGLSKTLRCPLGFAMDEDQDYDFVVRFQVDDTLHYKPVQLKELPPEKLNSEVTLSGEIEKLKKYTDSSKLAVAMFINRSVQLDLSKLVFPKLPTGELWFFGNLAPDQSKWFLCGDLLAQPEAMKFSHPSFEK